ncbi:transposase [Limnoglobus roseus]|uniref:Transposase n=1 Tax=Limnoglobus roseus TaxID=2598579 RepID=A0A5C1ARH5_9BACT|nr:transposase [Limnoglobus roseus]QEL20596.1 transposase [Limnoglobus roseus]
MALPHDPRPGRNPALASVFDPRSAPRLAWLLVGAVRARGRRTVTSWIRAAGLSGEYRPLLYDGGGRRADPVAARLVHGVVKPLVAGATRLTFALDDTPTPRYGRHVQGAGVHHNPTPGPAGGPFVYGHVWVVLGLLVTHPAWGVVALPLMARLYVREKTLPGIPAADRPAFRTKLELAVELMRWARCRLGFLGKPLWVVADGAFSPDEDAVGVSAFSRPQSPWGPRPPTASDHVAITRTDRPSRTYKGVSRGR